MKYLVYGIALSLVLLTACTSQNKYNADKHLNNKEKSEILLSVIRYMGHLPQKGSHENKFESRFDDYYSKLSLDYTLDAYHREGETEFFMASRLAPSLKVKKVAIGVKLKRNAQGEILHYEEVFRTWKFEEPELEEKGFFLFDLMVKGTDLSPYYPQNSGKEEYIEFPDTKTVFDLNQRKWITVSDL